EPRRLLRLEALDGEQRAGMHQDRQDERPGPPGEVAPPGHCRLRSVTTSMCAAPAPRAMAMARLRSPARAAASALIRTVGSAAPATAAAIAVPAAPPVAPAVLPLPADSRPSAAR